MNCVLQTMDSWNHPNFSYLNLHLSELPTKMIFIDIFCCALNGKYSALYIEGRRDTGGRGRKGGGEEEERRKGEEGVSSMCV